VTYHLAYVPGEVSLCDDCAADEGVCQQIGVLGAVSHGAHDGRCDGGCGDPQWDLDDTGASS
jgi:hypothetical protein